MDAIHTLGIELVVAIQNLGGWLQGPMEFFSFLGQEQFFLLILPTLYWSVDTRLGLRVGLILLVSVGLVTTLKMVFHGPRPYWYSPQVQGFAAETSFGVPSGHAQNAVGVWGMLADGLKKKWAWPAAIAVIFLIGFSRMYLGVHFPHDVIVGWLVGTLLLWAFLALWDRVGEWFTRLSVDQQLLFTFLASLVFILLGLLVVAASRNWQMPQAWLDNATAAIPDGEPPAPFKLEGLILTAGAFFGLAGGAAWLFSVGSVEAGGAVWRRLLRFLVGIVGVLVLYLGLGGAFSTISPEEGTVVSYILRYIRYALIGLWISAGAPLMFLRLRLSQRSAS